MRQVVGSGSDFGRFSRPRFLVLLSIVSLSTLWLVLNGLVYLITDVDGIAYTFRLSAAWVRQASPVAFAASGILLAGTGTLVLLSARRILPWKGSLTMVVGLGALVTLLANLTFRTVYLFESGSQNSASAIASFIPLYVLFLAPVIVFDLLAKIDPGRNKVLLAGVLLGPFVSFLDGFYSLVLWTGGNVPVTDVFSTGRIYLIIALAVPMATAGAIAGFSRSRFSAVLLSARHWPK